MLTNLNNAHTGDLVEVSGMIHNVRVTKWGGFIILRKSRGLLQTVVGDQSKFFNEQGEQVAISLKRRRRHWRPYPTAEW